MNRFLIAAAVATASSPAFADKPKTVVLERVEVPDSTGKIVASTLYKPKGWTCDMEAKWYPGWFHQVCVEGSVSEPNGLERYRALQWARMVYIADSTLPTPNRMTGYLGGLYLEPMKPGELFEATYLKDGYKKLNAKVVGNKDMPEVAAVFVKQLGNKNVLASKTRLKYKLGDEAVEEDVYIVCDYNPTETGYGKFVQWGPATPPFSLRAAEGKLDAATPRLLAIMHSHRATPALVEGIVAGFAKDSKEFYDRSAAIDRLSKSIGANNDAMLAHIRSERTTRWAAEDRSSKQFSDYIRGVDAYTDGRTTFTVPSGYTGYWSDGRGTVVLSDDADYDPNRSGNGTWSRLAPAK